MIKGWWQFQLLKISFVLNPAPNSSGVKVETELIAFLVPGERTSAQAGMQIKQSRGEEMVQEANTNLHVPTNRVRSNWLTILTDSRHSLGSEISTTFALKMGEKMRISSAKPCHDHKKKF